MQIKKLTLVISILLISSNAFAIDIVKTLQYMKPTISVVVWENDINRIEYDKSETFRPTKAQILAVDQDKVEQYFARKETESNNLTKEELLRKIDELQTQIEQLQ